VVFLLLEEVNHLEPELMQQVQNGVMLLTLAKVQIEKIKHNLKFMLV